MLRRYKYESVQQRLSDRFERKKHMQRRHVRSRQDFVAPKQRTNPFRREQVHQKNRQRIVIITGIVAFISTIGLGLYHPFFAISALSITGLQRISEQEMQEAVYGILDYNRLFIFPGNNYFIIDVQELKDILKERFPIEHIVVKKVFPHNVSISIEEKISTVIYDNGQEYSYVDLRGNVVEKIRLVGEDEWDIITEVVIATTTSSTDSLTQQENIISRTHTPAVDAITAQYGNYPIIYTTNPSSSKEGESIVNPTIVSHIIEWYALFEQLLNIPFGYAQIGESPYHATLYTKEGWAVLINIQEDPEIQARVLQHTLTQEIDTRNMEYIDIRFPQRVYWK